MRRGRRVLIAAGVAAVLAPGAAVAGKPTTERIAVDRTFADTFLTQACGIDVQTRVTGHVTVRTFDDGRLRELVTISLAVRAVSAEGVYRFRDVGMDQVRTGRDGTLIVQIAGQVPFQFTGVLRETGDGLVIKEPRHSTGGRVQTACAALNPA